MTVKDMDTVKVNYTGTLEDGKIFDSSQGREPLVFRAGSGMMIPGFDKAVIGMKAGEKKKVSIPPEEGYGDYYDDRLIDVDIDKFPEGMTPEPGMHMELTGQNGVIIPAVIKEVGEKIIVLDANHPLAGKTINFEIEVLEIGCKMPEPQKHECCCSDSDCNNQSNNTDCGCNGC